MTLRPMATGEDLVDIRFISMDAMMELSRNFNAGFCLAEGRACR